MNLDELLIKYKNGELDLDAVKQQLSQLPYEDLDFAKLDHHRHLRTGYGEVVYCSGKVTEHLVTIFEHLYIQGRDVLGSRATPEQFHALHDRFPEADYDPVSKIVILRQPSSAQSQQTEAVGNICVCTGGTADVPVAEEAAKVAEFFGNHVTRVYDVGVAGIHRLLDNLSIIQVASCIIAVAGMEGALPGVIAGLVSVPVIGVPTSIGYGTGYAGASAILTMLNSCANGIATVNIDNGFGAAYLASQINHQTAFGRKDPSA